MEANSAAPASPDGWTGAVTAGLMSLGWSAREAELAVQEIGPDAATQVAADGSPDVSALLKLALRTLDRS